LGNRALDILTVLVEHAGKVVSHRDLMARVWRGLVVDPGNLRVHINSLRRALDDGDGRDRYIANVTGQGYSFVAPVQRGTGPPPRAMTMPTAATRRQPLPAMLARMVGREGAVATIAADLVAERFVTVIGPGGIGKTTVAVSVAHSLLDEFADAVCFVELSSVTDPRLVAATVASALGLAVNTEDVAPTLFSFLRPQRILLVLDNCEHVIESAAPLAERVVQEAPGVHLLATSREAMRVEGEHAFWLPPLGSPPPDTPFDAAQALAFPAIRLFVDRAAASGVRLVLSDADAATVASICAGLDGLPLAIEFAAARVGAHGLDGTAQILKSQISLQWKGRRTALPRHQTLHSLLDWSHDLLLDVEKRILRRLSVFVGTFTLEAAQAVAADGDEAVVVAAIESLVAKFLVSRAVSKDVTRYRLLETTRVYALEKLERSGEQSETSDRHARYCTSVLSRIVATDPGSAADHLGNIRAALEWAYAQRARDPGLLVKLAASAVRVFIELSLLTECHRWSRAALASIDDSTRGGQHEMRLQEALAFAATYMIANHEGVGPALERALAIARSLDDPADQLRLLTVQNLYFIRAANIGAARANALEFAGLSRRDEAASDVVAELMLGITEHFLGNQSAAIDQVGRGLQRAATSTFRPYGQHALMRANIVYVRALWMGGFPDRALAHAKRTIEAAESSGKALNICFSRLYTAPVFLWRGDLDAAREGIERAITHPNWPSLVAMHDGKMALQGTLWLREGDIERAVATLQAGATTMRANGQTLLLSIAVCSLTEGLAAMGRYDEADDTIGKLLADLGPGSEASHLPEMLRMQAHVAMSRPSPDFARAEESLARALTVAREHGALSWELRAAMMLARLRQRQGRSAEALHELSSIYHRFNEGTGTADLRAAAVLLRDLGGAEPQASPSPR
jgi:predicted ATPase/DNA-binding winged helix-turn-helix (wHTH) protein